LWGLTRGFAAPDWHTSLSAHCVRRGWQVQLQYWWQAASAALHVAGALEPPPPALPLRFDHRERCAQWAAEANTPPLFFIYIACGVHRGRLRPTHLSFFSFMPRGMRVRVACMVGGWVQTHPLLPLPFDAEGCSAARAANGRGKPRCAAEPGQEL